MSPMRYPGAKTKLIPILMNYIDHIMINSDKFCDAFVGGGSVLLHVASKYPKIELFANDKDIHISSFWKIVADVDLTKLLELFDLMETKPTVEHFYKLREAPAIGTVDLAYRGIFFNRTAFSGIASSGPIGGKEQKSKYPIDCRYNLYKLKKKIYKCRELLVGRTTVTDYDINEYPLLTETEMPTYIDPPYVKKGTVLYPEKMSLPEHQRLASILCHRNNWVLSYDDDLFIRQLYYLNNIIDLSTRYCINGAKVSWNLKNELIILSR
jgi:DNA adenine methylase